jgi:hypothetical protein
MSESYASNPALAMALRRGRLSDQLLADSLKPRNVGGHAGGLAQMGTALIGGVMAGLDDQRINRLLREDRETADAQIAALYGRGPAPAASGGPAPVMPGSLPPPIPNPEMTGQPAPAGGTVMPVAAPAQMPEPPAPRMVRLANGQEINLDVLQNAEASPNQRVRLAAAGVRRSIDDDRAERRFQQQITMQDAALRRQEAAAARAANATRQPDEFERLLGQAGITPGSPQAQRFAQQRLERLGAPPQTNVNLPASETALLRADTDTLKAQNEASTQARGLISLFDRGEAAIKRLPTEGTAARFLPIFGQLASSLGFKVEGTSDAEILDSITTQLAVLQRAPGSGPTTDFEMRMFLRAVPELGKTREGNLQLLDMGRRLARRRIEEANIWRRNAGAPDIMDKLDGLGPVFNENERQMLNDAIVVSGPSPNAPGAAPGGALQPVQVSSPDEARRLPSGTPIILPDGTQGRVP